MCAKQFDKEEIEKTAREYFDPKFEEFAREYLGMNGRPACWGSGSPYYFCTLCNYSSTC